LENILTEIAKGFSIINSDGHGKHSNRPNRTPSDVVECVKTHTASFPTYQSHYSWHDNKKAVLSKCIMNIKNKQMPLSTCCALTHSMLRTIQMTYMSYALTCSRPYQPRKYHQGLHSIKENCGLVTCVSMMQAPIMHQCLFGHGSHKMASCVL